MLREKVKSLRTITIILLAIFGSSLCATLLIWMAGRIAIHGKQFTDYLPARETLFVQHQLTDQDVQNILQIDAHENQYAFEAYASIQLPNETEAIALFTKEEVSLPESWQGSGAVKRLPPFTVVVSDKDALTVLDSAYDQPLSRYVSYKRLSERYTHGTNWAYFRKTPTIAPLINTLLETVRTMSISMINDSWHIWAYPQKNMEVMSVSHILEPTPDTILSISSATLRADLLKLLDNQEEDRTRVLLSHIEKKIYDDIGPSVSWEYDIAPLVENQASLQLHTQSGAGMTWSLLTKYTNEKQRMVNDLHKSVLRMQQDVTVVSRVLDDRFEAKDVRVQSKDNLQKNHEQAGWTIRATTDGQERLLTTASNNEVIFITTQPVSVETVINAVNIQKMDTHTLSVGAVDHAAVIALLQKVDIDVSPLFSSLEFLQGPIVHWSLTEEHGLHHLVISP